MIRRAGRRGPRTVQCCCAVRTPPVCLSVCPPPSAKAKPHHEEDEVRERHARKYVRLTLIGPDR